MYKRQILEAAGSGYDKVIKTTCFLADIADFAAFNEVYAKYFTSKPARSCVAVKDLPKGCLLYTSDHGLCAGRAGGFVPDACLYFADVGAAQQQHAQLSLIHI